jgi:uncharacterized membrane protein YoaK (UPF0700 family)
MTDDTATDSPARPSGSLVVAMALTAVAGFTDAHIFVNVVQVFVANMSGNLVLLGIAGGDADWAQVGIHLLAIALFIAGVATGTTFHDRRRAAGRALRPDVILLAEAVLLIGLIGAHSIQGSTEVLTVDGWDVPIVAAGALAMGLQAAVIGRVGSIAVSTTYESGSVARVAEESALAVRADGPDRRARHAAAVRVLAAVLVAYVVGAAAAAALGSSPAWLIVPLAVVVLAAVRLRVQPSDS